MNWKKTLLICLIIFLTGGAATVLIFSTEPTASRSGATKQTAMLVDVLKADQGSFTPLIKVTGTVEASKNLLLSPRVSGEIIKLSESFTPGGFVDKREFLLQIDPSDYKNDLEQAKSQLRQAESDLQIEMGLQESARKEYRLLDDTLSPNNRALVLRKPQLEAAKSAVQSAEAAVDQAMQELKRTTLRAPFKAHVVSRNVNIGSQVAPGQELGQLVGLDTYWVEANVPQSKLRWLSFPGKGKTKGSEVKIRNRTAWEEQEYRTGHLYKMIGALETQTRMARVLITVSDPLSLETDHPPLLIGSFVEASIQAKKLDEVIRVKRDFIRQDETVWVMQDGILDIRNVDIVFQDAEYAYIESGLDDGDQVVTTNLSTVVDGAALRLEEPEESP